MIAEAVDAALLVWQALWLWFIAGAAVATLGGLGTVAVVWAVCRMLRRAWGAVRARGAPSVPSGLAVSRIHSEP